MVDKKHNLLGKSLDDLAELMITLGQPKFRAKQIYGWVFAKGVRDFQAMHNLGKGLQQLLEENCSLERPQITQDHISEDGTRKWLMQFSDGSAAECVYIPEERRGTLCISSQVGCSLTCKFCHTGTQKLVRNLTAGEIVAQLMLARDLLEDWRQAPSIQTEIEDDEESEAEFPDSSPNRRRITNIVMMGMGEPLMNTDHVIKAMQLFTDGDGIALTRRRVTLSTSGVAPEIPRVGAATGVALAVSLHAVNDTLRNQIVPINRKYPLSELMSAIRSYPGLSNARRVTFEYIMLDGVNDFNHDARALVSLIKGIPSKINLIPFNPWPGSDYQPSSLERLDEFASILRHAGLTATIRKTRGQDILAACGQLKSASLRLTRKEMAEIEALRLDKEEELGISLIG